MTAGCRHRFSLGLAGGLLAACLTAGCGGSGFSRQRFETVYPGMPVYAVERKLGSPQEMTSTLWVYTGKRPYYRAEIHLKDGRVVRTKYFIEPPKK